MLLRPLVICLLSLAIVALFSACGGAEKATVDPAIDTAEPAVDAKLMSELSAELERVLAAYGTDRRTNAAPTGAGSRVADLAFYPTEDFFGEIGWSYRNQGDYDLNGVVSISDLTPIGIHFGKRFGDSDWLEAQYADGDGNGEVNIGDVTPIGQNFGGQVDGYELQTRPESGEFSMMQRYDFSTGVPQPGGIPRFTHEMLGLVLFGTEFRVLPYVETGGTFTYGESSTVIGGLTHLAKWPTACNSASRLGLTFIEGPTTNNVAWTRELEGSAVYGGPVSDGEGNIYLGTWEDTDDSVPGGERGHMYCITRDGDLSWHYTLDTGVFQQPVLGLLGNVVFSDEQGRVYSMTPDGKVNWITELVGACRFGWIQSSNLSYFLISVDAGDTTLRLNRLLQDGSIDWNRVIQPSYAGPFLDGFDRIGTVSVGADLTFHLADGTEDQTIPIDGSSPFISGYAMALDGTVVLPVQGDDNRIMIYPAGFPPVAYPTNPLQPSGALGVTSAGNIVFNTEEADVLDPLYTSELTCITPAGAHVWTIPLGFRVPGSIAVDTADRMYFVGIHPENAEANGVYCIEADQTLLWHHPTPFGICLRPAITESGALLICHTPFEQQVTNLIMLR